jgi:hypothetical protein
MFSLLVADFFCHNSDRIFNCLNLWPDYFSKTTASLYLFFICGRQMLF